MAVRRSQVPNPPTQRSLSEMPNLRETQNPTKTTTTHRLGPKHSHPLPGDVVIEQDSSPLESSSSPLSAEQAEAIRTFQHPPLKVASIADSKHIMTTLEQVGVSITSSMEVDGGSTTPAVAKCVKATEEAKKAEPAYNQVVTTMGLDHPISKHLKAELDKLQS